MTSKLLDEAVTAMRAYRALKPGEPRGDLAARASAAVTRAVVQGPHLHTQIAQQAGCPGLAVVDLIDDPDAQGHALAAERHAAERYVETVREAAGRYVLRRQGAEGRGYLERAAAVLGVGRRIAADWARRVQIADGDEVTVGEDGEGDA